MKRICAIAAVIMLLSSCAAQSAPPVSAGLTSGLSSPEVSPPEPTDVQEASPSDEISLAPGNRPEVSPGTDPMIDRTYRGVTFQVRHSWRESTAGDGAIIFELDTGCVIMLQQIEHGGETPDGELLRSVMEGLAPGSEYREITRDGFPGMSCQYVRQADGQSLQCISYAYVHGGMLSTISILLSGEYMDAAEATLWPVLDTLKLTGV